MSCSRDKSGTSILGGELDGFLFLGGGGGGEGSCIIMVNAWGGGGGELIGLGGSFPCAPSPLDP